jgi:queuine tRNA-ribosyltransferase
MPSSWFSFRLHQQTTRGGPRRSSFTTPHGEVQMPAFMPVGTLGTVKGISVGALRETGTEMVLGNAYHLALRPGSELIGQLGGLHQFMGWEGPILTDSGGYQIFSLASGTHISEQAATFRSHIDGSRLELSPERAVAIQEDLGSDVAMVLDHVVALPGDRDVVADAMRRSIRWAGRCQRAAVRSDQAMFAIVQGGLDAELRAESAATLVAMDFDGYAIGGLSVGEKPEEMLQTLDVTMPHLPVERPRYLMGVGRPEDLLHAIARGVDLFDCVMPTRCGRHAVAFTDQGPLRLRNLRFREAPQPLEAGCPCPACRHSRGYLRHLFMAGEMLGPVLLSIHNVTYYQRLLSRAREAILADRFDIFHQEQMAGWLSARDAKVLGQDEQVIGEEPL